MIPGTTRARPAIQAIELLRYGSEVLSGLPGLHDPTDDLTFARIRDEATAQPGEAIWRDTQSNWTGRLQAAHCLRFTGFEVDASGDQGIADRRARETRLIRNLAQGVPLLVERSRFLENSLFMGRVKFKIFKRLPSYAV